MCLIKRKILSGNFYNWIEESFDSNVLKLISVKLSFRMRFLVIGSLFAEFFFLIVFQHIRKSIYCRNKDTISLIFPWLYLELVEFLDFSLIYYRQSAFPWFLSEFPDLADTLNKYSSKRTYICELHDKRLLERWRIWRYRTKYERYIHGSDFCCCIDSVTDIIRSLKSIPKTSWKARRQKSIKSAPK